MSGTWDTPFRDRPARQRTELANERTLLSYIRTALGFVIVGIPAVWWLEMPGIQPWGILSLATAIMCLVIGVRRFFSAKAVIDQLPD
ncbi:MAG TPA: DUF202 domain-containing protein [Nitrospira sp.]|nr:DUF202 domain-containing protein [Nitrospira sp.]